MTNKFAAFYTPAAQVSPALPSRKSEAETGTMCFWEVPPKTDEEAVRLLKQSPLLYGSYQGLNEEWKRRFLDFCRGRKTLPLTYDPFFKRIFHPDVHPDRLSRLISSIMGVKVKILRILPTEDSMLDGGTLLIMDLLAELEDGSLVNIEIQKQGYAFPAERISCYSSDLLMRQYARVKGARGSAFTYRDIKKVYVIVLYEKSPRAFHKHPDSYVHHGETTFDTGLQVRLLQEYFLVALDVFQKFPYPKIRNEQTAWLSLLTTETPEDAERLTAEYPWLQEIYEEIAMLRQRPEEVLGMFSEALKILDRNTVNYMIDELQKELAEKSAMLEEKDATLEEKSAMLKEKDAMIASMKKEKEKEIAEKDAAITQLKKQLKEALAAAETMDQKD